MDKHKHRSTIKYACRSTCIDAQGSMCTEVLLKSRACTEATVMHIFMSTDISTGKMVMFGSMCMYDAYRMNRPKRESIEPGSNHIGTESVVKVQKCVNYDGYLHWVS